MEGVSNLVLFFRYYILLTVSHQPSQKAFGLVNVHFLNQIPVCSLYFKCHCLLEVTMLQR